MRTTEADIIFTMKDYLTTVSAEGVHYCCYTLPIYLPSKQDGALYSSIDDQQAAHSNGFFIITGAFNHSDLGCILPEFQQQEKLYWI